jgi:type III secretory pathway component EscS
MFIVMQEQMLDFVAKVVLVAACIEYEKTPPVIYPSVAILYS